MRLLFVCTGNTCRSPMAEAIARKVAIERGLGDVDIASAGTSASPGMPASDGALLVGLERRLDLTGHRAQQLTRPLVASSDLVLVMSEQHLGRAIALGGEGKSYLLTDYASGGADRSAIDDPVGGDLDVYRATAQQLAGEIERVFDRLATEPPAGTA